MIVPRFLPSAKPNKVENSVTRSAEAQDKAQAKYFMNDFLGLGKATDGRTPERMSRSDLPAATGDYTMEM